MGPSGLAARASGHEVCGFDPDTARLERAVEIGALDAVAPDLATAVADADLVVVAVPVGRAAEVVVAALDAGAAVVTDVGSVKAAVVSAVEAARPDAAARFVGGHPMAGSEQDGPDGADADMFQGATWVLTPTPGTDPAAYEIVHDLAASFGAEVLAVSPDHHDALVAVVSHVPQLAATTLMDVAARRNEEHTTLLRLAAGGFRDMTRIASGHPAIWPDICVANRDAIVAGLDDYLAALEQVRALVAGADRRRIARPDGAGARGPPQPPGRDARRRRARRAARAGARPARCARRGHDGCRRARRQHRRLRGRALGRGIQRCARARRPGRPAPLRFEDALTERGYHHSRAVIS